MCGTRSDCSRMGSLGYEISLICFYIAGPRGIRGQKQATSLVIRALEMKKKLLVSILLTGIY